MKLPNTHAPFYVSPLYTYLNSIKYNYLFVDENKLLWDTTRQSSYIQSILIRCIPMTPFIISAGVEPNIVVDGTQRLVTVKQFMEDKFSLSNMKFFPELNGLYYSQLEETLKTQIEERSTIKYLYFKETPDEIIKYLLSWK